MELRKIQLTGKSTYTLSLPKSWAKRYGIKKGTRVSLYEQENGTLVVSPKETTLLEEDFGEKTTKIGKDYSPELVRRLVIAAYIEGHGRVRLILEPGAQQQRLALPKINRLLAGVEIIKETPGEVVLKCLLTEKDLTILEAIQRMTSIVARMLEEPHESETMEEELDKFMFLTLRLLRRVTSNKSLWSENGIRKYGDLLWYIVIARAVEEIGDELVVTKTSSPEIKKIVKDAFENIKNQDRFVSEKIMNQASELKKTEKRKKESRVLDYVKDICESVFFMANN